MNGWVKLYRKMREHAVWQLTDAQFKVWITCLLLANHKEAEWWDGRERVQIPPGSFITSQPHLATAAGVGRQVIRDALTNLQRVGSMRTKIQTKRWTLVEIVNWPSYQGEGEEENQEENRQITKDQPSENHNGRMKEGKKNSSANDLPPGFAAWWEEYPKKVGKIQAVKEWRNLNPDDTLQVVMLQAIRNQKRAVKAMVENDKHHILDPERWIKYRRWEDEVSSAGSAGLQYPRL